MAVYNRVMQDQQQLQVIARAALRLGAVSAQIHGQSVRACFEARDRDNTRHGHACAVVRPGNVSLAEYDQASTPVGIAWARTLARTLAKLQTESLRRTFQSEAPSFC